MFTLSVTIEENLLKGLDQSVEEAHLSGRSEAVRMAIRNWLEGQNLQKMIRKEIAGYKKKPVSKKNEFHALMNAQRWPE